MNHEDERIQMATVKQAAKAVRLPVCAIRRMVKEGTCPYTRVGNRIYINLPQLYEVLENRK